MLLACQYDDATDASWWLLMDGLCTSFGEASQGKAARTDKEVRGGMGWMEVEVGTHYTL